MLRESLIAVLVAGSPRLAAQSPATLAADSTPRDSLVRYRVRPSATDPAIKRFDLPHYIVFTAHVKADAPLLVFMPGTGGRPANTTDFADVAARQGYRVIGLEYTDTPAVGQVCPRNPDPRCAAAMREKRIFGDDATDVIDDPPEESVVNRLTTLLALLDREHPGDGWAQYLANGQPVWTRIAVSGLSQGAGMAAYIAKKTTVARVVLFSSPWDFYGRFRELAPWIAGGSGATPVDRWFAAYQEKEPTADLIVRAYRALRIPAGQIRKFTLEPAMARGGRTPYHPSGVANAATPRLPDGTPAYIDDWRFLLGDVR
jgi:dienelactone hydrolase